MKQCKPFKYSVCHTVLRKYVSVNLGKSLGTRLLFFSQPKSKSYQVNDHFDCTTSNIIYCITCTLCNKLYIGESGRKLGDRFREHLLDVKNKGSDLSKPVARHFNLPDHSHEHMEICGIYLHLGNNETRKRKEQRLIFKLGTLAPNGINERFSFA